MFNQEFTRQALLTLHFIGLAFGFGGATVADLSFFRALKAGDSITPETVKWMRSFSRIVWIGIGILTVSGTALFLMNPSHYLSMSGFSAKMVVVGILIANGMFLNFYTTARLTTFNFSQKYTRRDAAWKVRKLSFVFGAIGVVSWYSALIISQFKSYFSVSFYTYIGFYLLALVIAIAGSLVLEHILHNRSHQETNQTQQPTIEQLSKNPPPRPPVAPQSFANNPALPTNPNTLNTPVNNSQPPGKTQLR